MSAGPLNTKEQENRNTRYRKYILWLWILFAAGILGVIAIFFLLSRSDLPTIEELENPKSELASEIYGSNGQVLGRYYVENRVPVAFNELSPHVVRALVATEDERYFNHCGIDFRALGRVAFKTVLLRQKSSGGASTITQQLAKLLFTEKPGSGFERVVQKLKEWIIALRLERRYTKEEIIAMYLNKFDFLYDSDGIKAAAETYFGKDQSELNLQEAAVLVGMLKNPSLYNPRSHSENAVHRREVVLKQMYRNRLLTEEVYDSVRQLPLDMSSFRRRSHAQGLATYFRMELAKLLKFDILEREECRKTDGTKYDIYRDGLKIYTTVDPVMQEVAEQTMAEHMKNVQGNFWKTWKNYDPWTYRSDSDFEIPLSYRQRTLQRLIWESDRYQLLREEYLEEARSDLFEEIGEVSLRDVDMDRILEAEKGKGTLASLLRNEMISTEMAEEYRRILESASWKNLKEQWLALQEASDSIFNEPVSMKVFAYNDQFEKDTVMSPLDSIKYHRMFLQTGILAVDPLTGHVKVWIGGINHKYFQYDHVTTPRQVGSTFKPFVYASAINLQGISPCFTVYDQPQTIAPGDGNFGLLEPWTPSNADGKWSGELLSLYDALKKSVNSVSVFLMKQLGDARPVIETVSHMGINAARVPVAPSICLGSCDLTVMELTGAYTTFANNGIANRPIFITRIEDKNGRTIFRQLPEESQALSPNANYVMVDMLKYAVSNARGFGELESNCGGKTGTTNDYVDGWFMGVTPSLVVGTWVGGEDRWIRFRSLDLGQGAVMARPFFSSFIRKLEQLEEVDYRKESEFFKPPGELGIVIDCNEYKREAMGEEEMEDTFDFSEDPFGDESLLRRDTQQRIQ